MRAKSKGLLPGDHVAAVGHFLTKADDRFATLHITRAESCFWADLDHEIVFAKTLADEAWYRAHIPMLGALTRVHYYEWELIQEETK